MLCVDVNVLVYAHRADLREHADYRGLLERLANDDEPLGLPDSVLAGFIRVVTNRRVFTEPTSPQDAWQAVDALLRHPQPCDFGLASATGWPFGSWRPMLMRTATTLRTRTWPPTR